MSSLQAFCWNAGGEWAGKAWSEELPTDSALLLFLFVAFLAVRSILHAWLSFTPGPCPDCGHPYVLQLAALSTLAGHRRNAALVCCPARPQHAGRGASAV